MFVDTDLIPLPSKGLFYKLDKHGKPNEYIEVAHLITEDELALTSPNLFATGDAMYRLLNKKIIPYNTFIDDIDDLLVYDKDFIILWLRENAYGNLMEDVTTDKTITFNTHDMQITYLDIPPNDKLVYDIKVNDVNYEIAPITVFDERRFETRKSKLTRYISHVKSVNGNTDYNYINTYIRRMPMLHSRSLKKYIDRYTYGVNTNTFYTEDFVRKDITVELDEIFFGFNLDSLDKTREMLQSSIFFLMNEGQGYTNDGIMSMRTSDRVNHIERLGDKIKRVNDEVNKK